MHFADCLFAECTVEKALKAGFFWACEMHIDILLFLKKFLNIVILEFCFHVLLEAFSG